MSGWILLAYPCTIRDIFVYKKNYENKSSNIIRMVSIESLRRFHPPF